MNANVLVEALYIGAVYALVGLGFTIIYSTSHVLNFAQGEFMVFGAIGAYQIQAVYGWHPLVMIPIVVLFALVFGAVQELMIMYPVRLSGTRYAWIVATLATAIIFQNVFGLLYPSALLRPPALIEWETTIGGVKITAQEIVIFFGALGVMGAYDFFLRRTALGRAIRATAHDGDTAGILGVNTRLIVLVSFMAASLITVTAGVLAAPTLFIGPTDGLIYTMKGFVAMVIGGLGSVRGVVVGGFIVGLLDVIIRNAVSPTLGNMATVFVLAVILVVFPAGLFGKPVEGH